MDERLANKTDLGCPLIKKAISNAQKLTIVLSELKLDSEQVPNNLS